MTTQDYLGGKMQEGKAVKKNWSLQRVFEFHFQSCQVPFQVCKTERQVFHLKKEEKIREWNDLYSYTGFHSQLQGSLFS